MKRSKLIALALCALCSTLQAQELLNYPLDTVNGEEVYRYEVERGIGLYRIGMTFNVTQNEIMRLNPQLKERGVHFGEVLLLPTYRPISAQAQPQEQDQAQSSAQPQPQAADTASKDTLSTADIAAPDTTQAAAGVTPESPLDSASLAAASFPQEGDRHVIELALMLPFESQQTKRSGNAERMMEFYQGALSALRDLQNDSTLYRLRVYDTERSERKVTELCDGTELDNVRGILGLVYPIQIERMITWCDQHQVPLLLPFSDDADLTKHHQLYQFNSPDADEAYALARWIEERQESHCVFVETRESDISPSIRQLRYELKANDIPYTSLALRDLLNDSAAYAMNSNQENIIILHSDRYQQIRMLLPHLAKLQENYKILLVSQYAWQKEFISLPQVYTSKFLSGADLTEYDRQWEESFVNRHVTDMPRYDLLGYDLMRELVHIVRWESSEETLQSPFQWESTSELDGWQNTYIRIEVKEGK